MSAPTSSGTVDKAVELTTWNANDRTDAGVGPCSTLAELKRAYGKRLKLVPNNHGYGYTVGKHLFFAIGTPPHPRFVSSVAVYSNELTNAGVIALDEGPCTGPASAIGDTRDDTGCTAERETQAHADLHLAEIQAARDGSSSLRLERGFRQRPRVRAHLGGENPDRRPGRLLPRPLCVGRRRAGIPTGSRSPASRGHPRDSWPGCARTPT